MAHGADAAHPGFVVPLLASAVLAAEYEIMKSVNPGRGQRARSAVRRGYDVEVG